MDPTDFKKPIKLSDLMQGTVFELNTITNSVDDESDVELMWSDDEDLLEKYANPCDTTFAAFTSEMDLLSEGLHKKVLKKPADDAPEIDLLRNRITYHRNLYFENEDQPFDSTYMNKKPDTLCLGIQAEKCLEGIAEALQSMKEGEHSHFIISYKKMFKELGCPPRIHPKADILCDLKVLKVDNIGDQASIDKLMKEVEGPRDYNDLKDSIEETRTRAADYFSKAKYNEAIKLYRRIVQICELSNATDDKERESRNDTLIRIHTNLTVCLNKKQEWSDMINHIKRLESLCSIDGKAKILYHKGRALLKLGELDEAEIALSKALKLSPMENQIIKSIEELQKRKTDYKAFNKNFAKNLNMNAN